jgi:DNA replication licensing factor MCM5
MSTIYHVNTFDGDYAKEDSLKVKLKSFLKEFYVGNHVYIYRNQLRDHFNLREYWINVCLEDLDSYDEVLSDKLKKSPSRLMELFEAAATEVCDDITQPRSEGMEIVPNFQVMIHSIGIPTPLRNLSSEMVSKLITVSGIVVAASPVRAKAIGLTLQCIGCRDTVPNISIKRGLDGYQLPRQCPSRALNQGGTQLNRCPLDPYHMLPDKCKCMDMQTLKLQELPEDTPQGGMPRHLKLYCDRYLCDKFAPGNRVTLFGVFSIIKIGRSVSNTKGFESNVKVGLRSSYLNVVGYKIDTSGPGHTSSVSYTAEEEEEFRILASSKDCYKKICSSIAPAIFGFDDVKKAIACLLFAGSEKKLPDNTRRRGDINILLLGDPGTAKSQVLKFAEQVAPIGVYTSGKGSSAAGLTASVIKDNSSRQFSIEGGAMVLADGGIVCIDEFDKMREDDRVAIHEAMEQQTISIAKAGITVTLNSRCAVLAAANSVHGRWDDYRSDEDNIDFMPTILSRFDMIFVIKDKHDYDSDRDKARHVLRIHVGGDAGVPNEDGSTELSLDFLKKYIAYCRSKVGPRIGDSATKLLMKKYQEMRNGPRTELSDQATNGEVHEKKSIIPITVRQLEATIRVSEALAKMELKSFADERHVEEALRLFKESTLKASRGGHLAGAEGFITDKDRGIMKSIEKTIRRRLSYGLVLDEDKYLEEFVNKGYELHMIRLVFMQLVKLGVLTRKGVGKGKFLCCLK